MTSQKIIDAKMDLLQILSNHDLDELEQLYEEIRDIWFILGNEIATNIFIEEGKEDFLKNHFEITL